MIRQAYVEVVSINVQDICELKELSITFALPGEVDNSVRL